MSGPSTVGPCPSCSRRSSPRRARPPRSSSGTRSRTRCAPGIPSSER
jgi:hypothetical protein